MKLNWTGGITKSLTFIFFVAITGYEAVKLIKQQKNPLDELLPSDTLVFGLTIVIPLAILAVLVWMGFWAIRGYTKPKLNWDEGFSRIIIVLIVACIIILVVFSFSENPTIKTICIVMVGLGMIASSDWIEEGLYDNNYDDDYDNDYDE